MTYICPNCSSQLYMVNTKLICGTEKCNFQCPVSNYNNATQPWNIVLCKDTTFWSETVFDQYPFILANEYKRIFTLLDENKRYGVIFQIKDMLEVLLKLPTLLVLNELCSNKNRNKIEDETIQFFLSKMLSLGDWHALAKRCLDSCVSENLKKILKSVIKLFDDNNIVRWRNDTLGHGALMFDDTPEFRSDIEKMLKTIKKHFEECDNEYLQISLNYKINDDTIALKGSEFDNKIFKVDGSLMFVESDKVIELNELIKVHNDSIFFFDSFCHWDQKTKMLCYLDAQVINLKLIYFKDMFENSKKYVAVTSDAYSSKLEDAIYSEAEENTIKIISKDDEVITPEFLYKWLEENLNRSNKGLYLIQMEKGMGKTTFSKILDPHAYNKKKFNSIVTRVYYVNSTYSYKVKSFENDIVELLTLNDKKTDKFKGDIPRFNNQLEASSSSQFVNILEQFKIIYKNKYGKEKLLIVIDGIDEIPDLSRKTILDYIPNSHEIPDDIYILITTRVQNENPDYINILLNKLNFTDKIQVNRDNENYNCLLKEYVSKKIGIKDTNIIEHIIKHSDNKFLFIKPIKYIIEYNYSSDLSNINVFEEFIKLLEIKYTEKYYYKIIDLLIILTTAREGLVIEEITYLLNEEAPDFKILAYLTDISCLLNTNRTYRGTVVSLSHESLREFILQKFTTRIGNFIDKWIENISDMSYENIYHPQKYIIFNILFLTHKYKPDSFEILFNSGNLNLTKIYENFAIDEISKYDTHLLVQFIDDLIAILEINPKKNASQLVIAYTFRMQAFLKYAFGSSVLYINYIDRALDIMDLYSVKDNELRLLAYRLRCDYYRRIGNIKKSMDDIICIEKLLYQNKTLKFKEIPLLDKVQMLLIKSINLKNLGLIDEALEYASEAKLDLEKEKSLDARFLYSNVLNNLGLCYLKLEKFDLAEAHIYSSIKVMESIKSENDVLVDNTFNNYANMGQILRKTHRFDKAIDIYSKSINEILDRERNGYLIDGNQKALHYNGRANVFRDLAQKNGDVKLYDNAISDFIEAIKIVENLERTNQDLRFLGLLYTNIITLYENNLNQKTGIEKYKEKLNELNRELLRSQMDLIDEDDITVDDQIYYLQAQQCIDKAYVCATSNKHSDAITLYALAIEIVERIKCFDQHKDELTEMLTSSYYSKALCARNLLNEKINQNFQLRANGVKVTEDYSAFQPEEIIKDFLKSLSFGSSSDIQKCETYEQISSVYCEAIKNYHKAKEYALKGIQLETKSELAYAYLGNACFELHEYESALKYYLHALEIKPEDEHIQNNVYITNLKLQEKYNKF